VVADEMLVPFERVEGDWTKLQVVKDGGLANRATARDLPLPQSQFVSESKYLFDPAHEYLLAGHLIPPFLRRLTCRVVIQRRCRRAVDIIPRSSRSLSPGFPSQRAGADARAAPAVLKKQGPQE
jgi:hypothetical protein